MTWATMPLRRMVECLDGRRIPLNREQRSKMEGQVPYWGAGGILDHVNKSIFDEPLVLLGEDGAPFFISDKDVAYLIDGPAWVNNHIHVLRPRNVDPSFLRHALNCADYGRYITGSTRDKLTQDDMLAIVISFPPLDEQRRIAAFLDAETARIDGLAAARQRMRDLLELKLERMVEQILGLDSSPRMVPLKYVVQSVSVGIVITPASWYVDDGGIPALRGLNIQPGCIDSSDMVQISQVGHVENMKSRLSSGDVVVVRTGQAGAAAIVPEELDGCNCIDLLIIRPGALTSSSFLAYYVNSYYVQDRISEHSVGSIQSHFNVGSMKKLDFPVLERVEQERRVAALDEVVGDLDLLDSQLESQVAILAERRQALITAAVTGQIDVTTARGLSSSGGVAV